MSVLPGPVAVAARVVDRPRAVVLVALVALLVVAGALRLQQAAAPHGPLSADERAYAALVADVANGDAYGWGMREPWHWAPGAPLALGAAVALDPGDGLRAAYALQALLGTLLVLAVFALGATVAGRRTGLVAAGVVAVYPPLVGLSGSLLSEALGALLVTVATLATVLAARRPAPPWAWAGAGVLWGAAVLTRADLLFAPGLVAVVLVLADPRSWPRRLAARRRGAAVPGAGRPDRTRGALLLLVGALLAVAPWSAWASAHAGGLVPVTTGGAAALFVGTDLPGGGTTFGAKRRLAPEVVAAHPRLAGRPVAELPAAAMLDVVAARHPELPREAAIARAARENLARYPLGDVVGYGLMTTDKLRRMWLRPSGAGSLAPSAALRVGHPLAVLAAVVLALLALWRRRATALALVLAPVCYAAALHALLVANPRYALPVLPSLLVAGLAGARALAPTALERVRARLAEPRRTAG